MIKAMEFTVRFDRKIEENKHYISPGGYIVNGKRFDFSMSESRIDDKDPTLLHSIVRDFDEIYFKESNERVEDLTISDFAKGFDEFYVYTGEYDDPEIIPKEVLALTVYYDDQKSHTFKGEVLESATKALTTG